MDMNSARLIANAIKEEGHEIAEEIKELRELLIPPPSREK